MKRERTFDALLTAACQCLGRVSFVVRLMTGFGKKVN